MLPGLDGLEVMRRLRELGETGPRDRVAVIMLTAKGEESDRVIGLRLGTDDYVVKRAIVEAHGGRIWLEPSAVGARVRFCLPAAPAA